jgi:hypothetical protein
MADGTLKVGTITTSSGSGTITIGQSGETIDMSNATQTGVGGANTPAFSAKRTSTQAIAHNTMTTVLFDTEVFDSDGKYDPSTGKFTPTVVGKYFVQTNIVLGGLSDNDYLYWLLKKNGSTFSYGQIFSGGSNAEIGATISGTIDLDADDDVRVDVYQGSGSSKNLPANGCVFSAYRIIGA